MSVPRPASCIAVIYAAPDGPDRLGAAQARITAAMPGTRRAAAVGCIARTVFAAFLTIGGLSMDRLVVTPAFTLLDPFTTPFARLDAPGCDERMDGNGHTLGE
jgi:hypothetical protein